LPPEVRLDPEQEDSIAVELRNPRVVEGVLRPVDVAVLSLDERHVRTRRLKVEEAFGIDVAELVSIPVLHQVAPGE
jgi:hypothetical protein